MSMAINCYRKPICYIQNKKQQQKEITHQTQHTLTVLNMRYKLIKNINK